MSSSLIPCEFMVVGKMVFNVGGCLYAPHERSFVDAILADWVYDVSFSCVVKTQSRWSNKIHKTELTKTR